MKTKLLGLLFLLLLFSCQDETKSTILLISNSGSSSVAKFDLNTGKYLGLFITENAGGLTYPDAITKLANRSLIVSSGCRATPDSVCSKPNSSLLKYDQNTGEFQGVFASASSSELLYRPYGTKVGKDSLVYVASFVGNAILRYNQKGQLHDVFAKSHGKDSLGLNGPNGLAFDADESHLFVTTEGSSVDCDSLKLGNCTVEFTGYPSLILKYDLSNGSSEVFTVPTITDTNNPPSLAGIVLAPNNKLFVADFTLNIIRIYDPSSGEQERTINIDIGTICNTANISDQYLGDLEVEEDGSILVTVGGNNDSDPGGVVRIIAPEYSQLECVISPTNNINRPIGLHVISE